MPGRELCRFRGAELVHKTDSVGELEDECYQMEHHVDRNARHNR